MVQGKYGVWKKAVSRALLCSMLAVCLMTTPILASAQTVLANGHVYLRKGATTQSDILVVLAPNAQLEVLDTQGEWYYVKYGSKKGYVRSDVVTVKGGTTITGATTGINTSVTSYRTLSKGSTGDDVLALETRLATLGFFDGEPNNKYDDDTIYAVRLFQEENGLKADGVAGERTQVLLLGEIGTAGSGGGITTTTTGAYRSLDLDDTGADVRMIQEKLAELGYYDGEITGTYGRKTKEAVRQYQKKNKLGADGIAGAKTQAKLFGETTNATGTGTGSTTTTVSTTLREGSTGSDVTALQQKLQGIGLYSGEISGTYGRLTKEAVRQYQKKNGLGADGIAGAKTLAKLFSEELDGSAEEDGGITDTTVNAGELLKEGSSGVQVTALQQKLKDLGYYTGDITGSYGRLTKEAVRLYQKAKGLDADGVAGAKTLALLNATPSTGTSGPNGTTGGTSDESDKISSATLKLGDRGTDVKNLQQRLKDLGYLAGSADGVFGSATESALMTFQTTNGLSADGVAGKNTQTVLYGANAKSYASSTDSSMLKRGSQGTLVKNMQQKLKDLGYYNGTITGNFGPLTEEAVKDFQRAQGLSADGIAGVNTLNKLYATTGGTTGGSSGTPGGDSGTTGGNGTTTTAPSAASVKNASWYNVIRPRYKAGTVMQIYDFSTGYSWQCVMMSNGKHADSQPRTADDTAIMYKAFGNKNTWTPKAVWITFPDGQTYIGSLHNVPHLSGSIKDNNFDGHLCIHFPREMSEAEETGPYAVSHQKAIIAGWEATQKMIK